jgi:hypothetical protein
MARRPVRRDCVHVGRLGATLDVGLDVFWDKAACVRLEVVRVQVFLLRHGMSFLSWQEPSVAQWRLMDAANELKHCVAYHIELVDNLPDHLTKSPIS